MRNLIIGLALAALLLVTIFAGVSAWIDLGSVEISLVGWLAMGAGVLLSLAVGGGLMALLFYSSRSGHDERSQRARYEDSEDDA